MSKSQENNKENKSPTLYTYYGKQYDFNDLRKATDTGFADYIKTLRRGEKDSEELWNAYSNIMSGIGDGSITFDNGRFNDSLGRYSNGVYYDSNGEKQTSKRKSKDYYGLVANYIAGKLGRSQEYQKPEDTSKIKWSGNNSLGLAFNRRMFNADSGNIMDFIDLDPYDEGTKSRKTDNRVKQVRDVTQYLYDNFDSLFTGYSDVDSQQAKEYLKSAITSLDDGSIDSQDYLPLSRAFGGINWRNMFNTQQSLQTEPEVAETQEQPTPELTHTQKFAAWVEEKYPKYTGTLRSRNLNIGKTYSVQERNTLSTALSSLQNNDLYRMIRSLIADPKYVFNNEQFISNAFQGNQTGFANQYGLLSILNTLKGKNLLNSFGGSNTHLYYIPNTRGKDNTGWVWDSKNNTLQQMDIRDIPYYRVKMLQEYKGLNGDSFNWATPYLEQGGIIKAEKGVQLNSNANWYSGVFTPQIGYILSSLKKDANYYKWLNAMQDKHSTIYNAAGSDFANKAYRNNLVGEYQDLYKSGYNNEWNDSYGYNSLGILNAQLKGMFNINQNGISGDRPGQWKTDNLYSSITDYRRLLGREGDYTDDQLAQVVQKFKDTGYDFTLGSNGYYKLSPIAKPVEPPVEPAVTTSTANTAQKSQENTGDQQTDNTYVVPVWKSAKTSKNIPLNILPDLIDAGRMVSSLVTNNRVTNTLMESLKPVLKDTYERYSPITGAFGEMQYRGGQAADLRSLASRPRTSDASLQLAGQLDANRQARDLEYQGFLADSKEIQRTREAALARQEDNMARRSEVANFNRASINQTDREKAQLQATNLRKNWESVDNFAQGVVGRLRTKMEEDRERRNNFRLQTSIADIDSNYQKTIQGASDEIEAWKASNPGIPISSMPNYSNYVKFIQDMQRWKQAKQYQSHADIYGYNYDNEWLKETPESIARLYGYKRGGSLKPSTMYLINKVIKNENNT